jgi:hypothetical protein
MVYTFTYSDCAGNSHVWTYTYTIDIPDFTCRPMVRLTVNCAPMRAPPTPPVMQDACGQYHHASGWCGTISTDL